MTELVLIANAGDGTVSTLRLEGERLTPMTTSPVGTGVAAFAVDAERDLVYAEVKADQGSPDAIATLRLDRETGKLTEIGRRAVDDSTTYLTVSDDGRFVLGASYGGGYGGVWPIDEDGLLGEQVSRIEHANLHCVVSEGEVVYFVSLGDDLVAQYRLGAEGELEPLGEVALPRGSGPRHLVLAGPNAYLVTEYTGEVFHFSRDDHGLLTRQGSVSIVDPAAGLGQAYMGADPEKERLVSGADVHPAGCFLLASERTTSTIATVALEEHGELGGAVAITPTMEKPRGFGVSGDGQHVIAVGEKATDAELSRVEPDGSLSKLEQVAVGRGANWVRVVAAG